MITMTTTHLETYKINWMTSIIHKHDIILLANLSTFTIVEPEDNIATLVMKNGTKEIWINNRRWQPITINTAELYHTTRPTIDTIRSIIRNTKTKGMPRNIIKNAIKNHYKTAIELENIIKNSNTYRYMGKLEPLT